MKIKDDWIRAQSEFSDLQAHLFRFLIEKGAEPLSITHSTTQLRYNNFFFEVKLNFLGLVEKDEPKR